MPGYTRIDNDILNDLLTMPGKTGLVYMALLSHRNQKTGLCNPSQDTIGAECNMQPRSVRRAILRLEAANLLVVIGQKGRAGRSSNQYMFPVDNSKVGGRTGPTSRGHVRQGSRTPVSGPKDRTPVSSQQERSEQDEDIAYCNTRGHTWGEVDNGSTLYCVRCKQEKPNNVIAL